MFVYGSLRKGAPFEQASMLEGRADYRGAGHAMGRLYRIDWYPGFVRGDDPTEQVRGDLFAVRDAALFAALDAYEGCAPGDPHPQEYRREKIAIRMARGHVEAWTYVYNWPVADHMLIPGGDFLALSPPEPPPRADVEDG
nr:gamma-glutamylcyclotransferase family protein [Sphingobium boeckii]